MTKKQDVVKELADAWSSGDKDVMRKHLYDDYSVVGPMMEIFGAEACIAAMDDCPFESTCESREMIEEGDKVVHVFDWVVTAPFQKTISTVEVVEFEGDQVLKTQLFYDTSNFPSAFLEQMKQMSDDIAA